LADSQIITLKNAVAEGDHSLGPETAPVTMVEYGNFECIDCGVAYPAIKHVRSVLGDNLRFVFRHFPTARTHPHSLRAAEAAEAAGAQGKFWEMHDELFTHQNALEDVQLAHYARRIGLDVDRFVGDLKENSYLLQVEDDLKRGLFDEHITGTPTIYINSVLYTGGTTAQDLLIAIKAQDTEGVIQLPESVGAIRALLAKLHHKKSR